MLHKKSIAVVIPAYNEVINISKVIGAIPDFVDLIVVVDDGSTDNTEEILRKYKDNRIKVINQANMGLTKSLNRGIEVATGKYIARMDSDDISLKQKLELQKGFLDKNPDYVAVGSYYKEINSEDKIISDITISLIHH